MGKNSFSVDRQAIHNIMKVLHINIKDFGGGAAIAAYRLHQGLCKKKQDSRMFVYNKTTNDPNVYTFLASNRLLDRIKRKLRRKIIQHGIQAYKTSRPTGYEDFSDSRSQFKNSILNQVVEADIIHLHWISGFLDYSVFFAFLSMKLPIVWTVHDMNPFTGGCHYDDSCERFRDQCGVCPQLGSVMANDLSRKNWLRKNQVLKQVPADQLYLVAPSQWMKTKLFESRLMNKFSVTVIPNGLDTDELAPRDKHYSRKVLGIPENAGVILFIADSVVNKRKGLSFLIQALEGIKETGNLFFLTVGRSKIDIHTDIPHKDLGSVTNQRMISIVYSAADIFVLPSLQDNLPNTVIESFACGTPVIGFDTGGIPDMVRDGTTGYLVTPRHVEGLKASMLELLKNPSRQKALSENCRKIAIDEYGFEKQAEQYIGLYDSILEKR